MKESQTATDTENLWQFVQRYKNSLEDECVVLAKKNDLLLKAVEKIGANIEGRLTAIEMQTIALEAINAIRI